MTMKRPDRSKRGCPIMGLCVVGWGLGRQQTSGQLDFGHLGLFRRDGWERMNWRMDG
jgi:hypothetical protein